MNELCPGIKVAHIGPRHIIYSQMIYGSYTLDLTILSMYYKNTILVACSVTSTSSDISWEGQLVEGFSSCARHDSHPRI